MNILRHHEIGCACKGRSQNSVVRGARLIGFTVRLSGPSRNHDDSESHTATFVFVSDKLYHRAR